MTMTSTIRLSLLLSLFFVLCGCTGPGGYTYKAWDFENQQTAQAQSQPTDVSATRVVSPQTKPVVSAAAITTPPIKVALLLPLSGQHEKLGQSMLQAAQIALFDVQHQNFELIPRDTKGTPDGAREAARSALGDGAQLILGPLFSGSVRAAKEVTSHTNVNMIAFSTDWTLASANSFIMGFVPFDQVERIISYAKTNGLDDIGVIAPDNAYGRMVLSSAQSVAPQIGVKVSSTQKFPASLSGLSAHMKQFTGYESGTPKPSYKAVLMPVGGNAATTVSGLMSKYGLPPSQVVRLGTGLMDDSGLMNEPNLFGTKFAAPSPALRTNFEQRYRSTYNSNPPRLATLAYDATALASILARRSAASGDVRSMFNSKAIMNPNGFAGIDGIFRFRPNGVAERGLAVLEFRRGRISIVEDAPKTFQAYQDF